MDAGGDFVVTWSSYGQEDGGIGDGFGIFARRFDPYGYPLSPEFQVNTTTAGNQQFASAAMSGDGDFVVVWQSDQNGIGDDIVRRLFHADGSPMGGPYGGEEIVNRQRIVNQDGSEEYVGLEGNQRYPDVAMQLDGSTYTVTWSSSHNTDGLTTDTDGYAVLSKVFLVETPDAEYKYEYEGGPVVFPDYREFDDFDWNLPDRSDRTVRGPEADGRFYIPIQVSETFLIDDLNVKIDIDHVDPSDLRIWLEAPDGTQVNLVSRLHAELDNIGDNASGGNGRNFRDTEFDDQADTSITDDTVTAPYTAFMCRKSLFPPQWTFGTRRMETLHSGL